MEYTVISNDTEYILIVKIIQNQFKRIRNHYGLILKPVNHLTEN